MSAQDPPPELFDRRQLRRQRARAARHFDRYAVLEPEACRRMRERLEQINRTFERRLEIGCAGYSPLAKGPADAVACDLVPALLKGAGPGVVADEELLPFREKAFDLVISLLGLHWTNDLPGALAQIKQILKPDGLLLAALLGGDSLFEMRQALTEAELELRRGAAARVAPFADIRDLGDLLQRVGFAMPVADVDRITVAYPDIYALMRDLRGSGNANALAGRDRRTPSRRLFARAGEIYQRRFAAADGSLPASFDLVFLTGWAPGPDQPVPKRPGSATHSLGEALAPKPERKS